MVKGLIVHKVPLVGELPKPEERVYYNEFTEKPDKKIKTLKVEFGKLTKQNVEQFRILNYLTLPVVY